MTTSGASSGKDFACVGGYTHQTSCISHSGHLDHAYQPPPGFDPDLWLGEHIAVSTEYVYSSDCFAEYAPDTRGVVFVYGKDGDIVKTLVPPSGGLDFGSRLAVDAATDTLFVRYYRFVDSLPRSYVAVYTGAGSWTLATTLSAPGTDTSSFAFGHDIAFNAGYLAISDPESGVLMYTGSGSAWSHAATLPGGGAVALSDEGDLFVGDDILFYYMRIGDSEWAYAGEIVGSTGRTIDSWAIAVSGDYLLTGISNNADSRGGALLFKRGVEGLYEEIEAILPDSFGHTEATFFGTSVAMSMGDDEPKALVLTGATTLVYESDSARAACVGGVLAVLALALLL
ncbi:hypothetical protein J8273_5630 [Carpediemonas membranifera]|uniref:Uncharacterized protein n=1 Tax=Carpediemonas membranifera TaxID=201153 RepID=A0A8J6B9Y6_9EUKA|nr:hypothetical protein J8273_5630 [Carpediemonas membranifera]|eukprot:KAG9393027.1 hypothetical protein J8273_5630 [Carpediemonas membranifera]